MVIIEHSFAIMVSHTNHGTKGQKEQTIFCITFQHSPSSEASSQKITYPHICLYIYIHLHLYLYLAS